MFVLGANNPYTAMIYSINPAFLGHLLRIVDLSNSEMIVYHDEGPVYSVGLIDRSVVQIGEHFMCKDLSLFSVKKLFGRRLHCMFLNNDIHDILSFSDACGVPYSTIYRHFTGVALPNVDALIRYSSVLHCTPNDLFYSYAIEKGVIRDE